MRKVMITGVSSGLGAALAERALEQGDQVYAVGRHDNKRFLNQAGYYFLPLDLSDVTMLRENLKEFVKGHAFDLVILNAGQLTEIKELSETSLEEIHRTMDLNVWANKQIIDTLDLHARPRQVVAVSSGAAVNGSKGWGAYALSKAALNMLIKLYAAEKPWTHFSAIAPGIVMTPMLEKILRITDPIRYPSIQRIKDGPIQTPEIAARRFLNACEKALEYPSGSFLDVRTIESGMPLVR
ncbi:MAG TPA: SDR family NAD(P)-dependent oxidoreductase [Nitratifractor salsuginis]|uniref:SDR family NAD(P)-dependent oxidoreductase n=1 Tax=Nitratifractor salsuginis TaxID=269261 RepID=A0A7V2WLM6_9BACT|nr:SDR family NAD(P)-dependent oxidoreductase [Nitratifractor salsuginis]